MDKLKIILTLGVGGVISYIVLKIKKKKEEKKTEGFSLGNFIPGLKSAVNKVVRR